MNSALEDLQKRFGYVFRNPKLLRRAVTHRSFASEHNERLEFLGDSVLDCVIGNALFKREDHFTEGQLSRVRSNLVCEKMLAGIARRMELADFLLMGEGEKRSGGAERPSILADAMEAIFGAVFCDGGFEAAERVILGVYHEELAALTPETLSKDPKTMLQELLQGERYARPEYFLVGSSGPAHDRTFDCGCRIPELGITTTGQAGSRRAAEQIAAKLAYDRALERIGSDRRES